MEPKKLVTRVKHGSNQLLQSTRDRSVLTVPKKLATKAMAVVQPANPEYTGPISANGTQEVGHEGEAAVQPANPEYTGPISANGTQEVGHEGEAAVQPANPDYTGKLEAKGTQESGHEGEALVQPENPCSYPSCW